MIGNKQSSKNMSCVPYPTVAIVSKENAKASAYVSMSKLHPYPVDIK
jgi:hypothetical protein